MEPPVAIGGVGGSGTRLVARVLGGLGFDLGPDLNPALDNLWYTLLFKEPGLVALAPDEFSVRARLFVAAMTGRRALDPEEGALVCALAARDRPQHPGGWLQERAQSLLVAGTAAHDAPRHWGWKEPNTHIALPQWRAAVPGFRYVHVVRNGLDMAFSRNQNQRDFWGPWLLGRPVEPTPRDSLAYWCAAHRRVAALGAEMGDDFLWLDYDRLCRDPEPGLVELGAFLRVPVAEARGLRALVEPPRTIGRGRGQPLEQFDPADLAYLAELGHLH